MSDNDKSAMFTSETDEWATPQEFFDRVAKRWGPFTLDPCCLRENAKCPTAFTLKENGLAQDWSGHRVWMNPPYGPGISEWIRKAWVTAEAGGFVVGLVPSRCDTAWWHEFVMHSAAVIFIRGRLSFGNGDNPAPFPSALVVWGGDKRERPQWGAMHAKAPTDETEGFRWVD